MRVSVVFPFCMLLAINQTGLTSCLVAQEATIDSSKKPGTQVVTFSTQDDHRDMQKQLGITKLRPGPSGDPNNANAANTDESKANPFPHLPELMTLKDGTKVTTREQWWKKRRPEIIEDFEREVLGRIPEGVPALTWTIVKTIEKKLGETDVIEKRLIGRADNSRCPEIEVDIMMSVITPKVTQGPVPALMQFGFTSWGTDGEDATFGGRRFGEPRPVGPPSKEQQLVEAGWAAVTINANSIQDDSGGEQPRRFGPPRPEGQTGGGLTRGIIGLTNKGQPRRPDHWGSLRAWAWGASRGLDYLESDSAIDAKRVGIDGVSRYGKAALVTMAFDERFATALVGSSGEGGASLYRRNFGEAVENLTGSGEYHWMAGNFLKYGTAESSFGSMNANDLPVDAHMLIALCAPRPTFISYGVPEKGDALWLDQQGSFMATIAAQPAFRLLGARDLGRSDDYNSEKMPPVNTDLLEGELAWRQHDGGHTDMPNIPHFIRWANRQFEQAKAETPARPSTYCNPISLPNYPIGRFARDLLRGSAGSRVDTVSNVGTGPEWMWRLGYKQPFRELADVTALWFDGKFYLYPSVDMAWVSEDLGATWSHHPLNVRDVGYAPTVVRHADQFLLMASNSSIYAAKSPLGPFQEVGKIELKGDKSMPDFTDPMLFSDSDQRLYFYWGCTPTGGIWGVKLDSKDFTKVVGTPKELIPFDPGKFPWEAVGQWNQNPHVGWMEGAWMLKRGSRYYLTFSAGGTENRTYAMGAYVSDSPLGPFVPQKRNPILRSVDGLITGTAHGSIIAGPNDELWAFYSVRASVVHAFERRLGMDRADIDANGELFVYEATSLPQRLPVHNPGSPNSHDPGWLPMNAEMRTIGSSHSPNLEGRFAVDNDLKTWWQPSEDDTHPTLTTELIAPSTIHAARIVWRDVGLGSNLGVAPGPIRYRVEIETSPDQWVTCLDRSQSEDDLLIDYRECPPTVGTRARLVVLQWPQGITPAVTEFNLFGQTK